MVGETEIDGEDVVVGSVVAGHSAYGITSETASNVGLLVIDVKLEIN
jgi:hypothetical protein